MFSLSLMPLVGLLPIALSYPTSAEVVTPPLRFAVLGDSWASGVSYDAATEYDKNKDNCFRNVESYGVQMKNDVTWVGSNIYFDFPACSGSRMGNLYSGDKCQVCTLQSPDLLILTIGGNDIGFFDVVDSCVYHSQNLDYGPGYEDDPDRTGLCAQAIDSAMSFIKDDARGLTPQLTTMYNELLSSEQAKNNSELRIYQTGYAHYFNIDPGSDWCNTHSFYPFKGPKLSHAVRAGINELVEQANQVVQQVTGSYKDQHVGYVSITEKYDRHRFCEPGSNWLAQYLSNNVWF